MEQVGVAEPLAMPGETVISPEAWEYGKDYTNATDLKELKDTYRKHEIKEEHFGYMRIDDVAVPPIMPQSIIKVRFRQRQINLLKRYIPAAIQPALKAGHDEHLAEMRDLSVLFVKCTGLNITSDEFGNCADVCSNFSWSASSC